MAERTPRMVDLETHHEYDGIREFDNPLPRWWLITFWGTIFFGIFYWFHYHNTPGTPGSYAELAAELAQLEVQAAERAAAAKPMTDDELLAMSKDPAVVDAGKGHFATHCIACHAATGASMPGGVGPNLTDGFWIHGSKPTDLHKTVSHGVPEKGMVAWLPTLGAKRVQEVVAYVITLQDTHVQGKEPQGVDADGKPAPAM